MAWDAAKPAGSQKIRLSDEEIRANWAALEAALAAEHQFPNTGDDGTHKLPVEDTLPSGLEGQVSIYNDLWHWYSNGAWRTLIPAGSKMLFLQAAAPSGWTQDTSLNDKVLRVVSGEGAGTGGDWTMEALLTAGHVLTEAELPAHTHPYLKPASSSGYQTAPGSANCVASSGTTDPTGSDEAHTHAMDNAGDWRPAYVDVIACTKD